MAQEPELKICPKCEHKNAPTASSCEKCGTVLRPSTFPVSNIEISPLVPKARGEKPPGMEFPGVALWVRNNPIPLIIGGKAGVLLGRRVGTDPLMTLIDLTDYNAYRLGVSRRHAQIECTENGCVLIDLGSSNGTWVNGLRLQPYQPAVLKNGDRVNLGRLELIVGPLTDEARNRSLSSVATAVASTDDQPQAPSGSDAEAKPTTEPADKQAEKPTEKTEGQPNVTLAAKDSIVKPIELSAPTGAQEPGDDGKKTEDSASDKPNGSENKN